MKDIIAGFNRCRKVTDFYRLQIAAEDYLSPTEFAQLCDQRSQLPAQAQEWLDNFADLLFGEIPEARQYARQRLGDHVWFFGHGPDEKPRPRLLIGFCGALHRLMVPISIALQHIDPDQFDIVVLTDPTRRRYLFGIDDFADDFDGIISQLSELVGVANYRTVECIGASSGGLAALRTAISFGAERAVLVGGRPMHMYSRKWPDQEKAEAGFEEVFAQAGSVPTRVVCGFAEDNELDRQGGLWFAETYNAELAPVPGIENHNILFELLKQARLGRYLDRLLLSDPSAGTFAG